MLGRDVADRCGYANAKLSQLEGDKRVLHRMTRYHFHFVDGRFASGKDSHDFSTYGHARLAAVSTLGQMLRDYPATVFGNDDLRVEVTDDNGLVLLSVIVAAMEGQSAPQ